MQHRVVVPSPNFSAAGCRRSRSSRIPPPLSWFPTNGWVHPLVCSDHDATPCSSAITEFFGVGLSSISIESGTPTIKLVPSKPGGPPLLCSQPCPPRRGVLIH